MWVVGAEVSGRSEQPSLRRAARWDGLLPQYIGSSDDDQTSDLLGRAQLVSRVRAFREEGGLPEEGYDVVLEADSTGEWKTTAPPDPAAWAGVGVTWWVERWRSVPRGPEGLAEVRRRIRAGPPG